MAYLQRVEIKSDTAYMEVPRCDRCRLWAPLVALGSQGECRLLSMYSGSFSVRVETNMNFGCVQWESKSEA